MIEDEELLMTVLNSTPVINGRRTDLLEGTAGSELVGRFGGTGTSTELRHLRETRDAIQGIIRREADAAQRLAATIDRTALLPDVTPEGIQWHLDAPTAQRLAARTALAWSQTLHELPGRLRACANTECNLFLIDRSRPGTAKWCSMSACGNRMKARAHAERARQQR
ncbi:CGNR zinc finger domain-containing protein [Saccharomonospora sp. CUA-673]|uniref:CGNR zinc finger domain-containing protein n=1 Tax=Saccharomonospora sp. CUA-673 TaxID=1904969 RepID=UPI0009FA8A18|nr:CGNR zinc finger domain-containing protein [Saccharomonospora sp. CUA-673]